MGIWYEVERKSDRMFRLAACQLDDLEQSLTLEELNSRLDDLPRDLSAMYDRMILNIPPEFKSDAFCLLRFLIHAGRPVTFIETVDHVSTQAENSQVDDVHRRLLVDDNMSSYCPGLVSITEESRDGKVTKQVQFAHLSVEEYLMSKSEFQPAPTAVRVAFTESYGSSTVASQLFSKEAVSTKPPSLEENINVTEDHATRQMAKTLHSHKQIESSCDDTNDDVRSLISGLEDIQSQDEANPTRWEVKGAAVNYLADMLTKYPNLGPLYEEAFKSLDDARFVRNHGRLLRRYYISLLLQSPSQKQRIAVDFLRPRSHRTLISRKILDNTGMEIVPVTLPQDNERNLILERFLNKVETHSVIQTPVAPNFDEGNETESSEEDDEEDFHQGLAFVDLEDAKSYFVSGTPLMQFETEFRDFLHPPRKSAIDTQEETQSQVNKETEQGVNAEPGGWSHNIVCLKNRLSSRLYDTCYPPKLGYQRVWYICECGDRMFLDVKELSPGGIQRFRQRFAKDGLARLLGASYAMTDQDATAGDDSRSEPWTEQFSIRKRAVNTGKRHVWI
ncbi:hypothetical protein GCG54_00002592 [Colletotrichum gloeosporioides]|uniref:Uncharacterized protein n=1 Tax=Colletotrichum gloeosporioides TaxID=474922 RepID=A0A8H4FPY5_COLGL|nr:uncharacterized protein GCG54_00002592 [Colletotrichum gloeosporioides]KAF3810140.1 hypothetical protein GCG54_00002592 [Colletotrichum gloeosporioides]